MDSLCINNLPALIPFRIYYVCKGSPSLMSYLVIHFMVLVLRNNLKMYGIVSYSITTYYRIVAASSLSQGPSQPQIHGILRAFFQGIRCSGLETDHLAFSVTKFKNACSYTATHPNVFHDIVLL
jgi:hypothetical protein